MSPWILLLGFTTFMLPGIAPGKRSYVFDERRFVHTPSLLVKVQAVIGEIFLPWFLVTWSGGIEHCLFVPDEFILRDRSTIVEEVHDGIDATITANASIVVDRIMESSRAIRMSRSS